MSRITGKFFLGALILLFLGAGAAIFTGFWSPARAPGALLPPCPYLENRDFSSIPAAIVPAIGAYEAVRETLKRGSTEGVSAQAEAIAKAYAEEDPKISSCAKRLAAEQDVESARRAFMRLNRLMEKHARKLPQN